MKRPKLSYILNDCNARILVTGRRNLMLAEKDVAQCADLQHIVVVDSPEKDASRFEALRASGKRVHDLGALLAAHPAEAPSNQNIDQDLASLAFSWQKILEGLRR